MVKTEDRHSNDAEREVYRMVTASNDTVIVDSHSLFGESNEVAIQHEGQIYRLRKTRYGKLILNK